MERYEVDKHLQIELYSIYDTQDDKYILENIDSKDEAELIAKDLNYPKKY